jgi:hypothetical protein
VQHLLLHQRPLLLRGPLALSWMTPSHLHPYSLGWLTALAWLLGSTCTTPWETSGPSSTHLGLELQGLISSRQVSHPSSWLTQRRPWSKLGWQTRLSCRRCNASATWGTQMHHTASFENCRIMVDHVIRYCSGASFMVTVMPH